MTDTSTNGTYINGEKMIKGETRQLCPDDHVALLKRDNGIDMIIRTELSRLSLNHFLAVDIAALIG